MLLYIYICCSVTARHVPKRTVKCSIESIKTTSMEDVSTRVLEKIKNI